MHYAQACQLFDHMDSDTKDKVVKTFELICKESGSPRIYEAFVQAVEAEKDESGFDVLWQEGET